MTAPRNPTRGQRMPPVHTEAGRLRVEATLNALRGYRLHVARHASPGAVDAVIAALEQLAIEPVAPVPSPPDKG